MNTSSDAPIDPEKELAGLDRIVEVITRLVLKFGRATTALLAVGGILLLCLVTLIIAVAQTVSIRGEIRELLDRQELLIKAQDRMEKTTANTQKVLTDTQAKVETVVESTPKLKVDSKTGKTKLVIKKVEPKEVELDVD